MLFWLLTGLSFNRAVSYDRLPLSNHLPRLQFLLRFHLLFYAVLLAFIPVLVLCLFTRLFH